MKYVGPKTLKRVRKWRAAGDSPQSVAKRLGVSYEKLLVLLETYPEFATAFFEGREAQNLARIEEVEDRLYERAVGYRGRKTKVLTRTDPVSGLEIMEDETIEEFDVAPDPSAQKFFLTNLAAKRWTTATQKVQVTHEVVHIYDDILAIEGNPVTVGPISVVDAEEPALVP